MWSIKIKRLIKFFSNPKTLFKIIIGFFIVEGLYFSLFAAYPQAFDENFHFGLIKIYSHHLSPFLTSQPAGGDLYGAVARDPSYFYQYLMSFPYRLFAHFFSSQIAQVIFLRVIDVLLFAGGLIIFKKIFKKIGLTQKISNIIILIFILIPIVPQVAGQVNYDNLVFLSTAWVLLLSVNLIDQIKSKKISATTILLLIGSSIFASIVKFEFMPIFLAIVLYTFWLGYRIFNKSIHKILSNFVLDFKKLKILNKSILILFVLLSLLLFFQRDGYNLIKYHTLSPKCDVVLNTSDCSAYSVWYHDYISHQLVATNAVNVNSNVVVYLAQWFYWIWYRLFFSVSGPTTSFRNYPPLPLPSAGFIIISLLTIFALIKLRTKIFKINNYFNLFYLVIVVYLLTLIYEGYKTYQYTGVLELMNGRYLLPILLLASAPATYMIGKTISTNHKVKMIVASIIVLLFLEGGGVITFITRNDSDWIWSNPTVNKINNAAKTISKHLVVEGNKYYTTNVWFF